MDGEKTPEGVTGILVRYNETRGSMVNFGFKIYCQNDKQ